MTTIPKIIHQIWIGTKPAPTKLMDTWKDKNPDFTYIRWNEKEIKKRKLTLNCSNRINEIEEINGKADIIRWEILYEYGGIYIDLDYICNKSFDDLKIVTEVGLIKSNNVEQFTNSFLMSKPRTGLNFENSTAKGNPT